MPGASAQNSYRGVMGKGQEKGHRCQYQYQCQCQCRVGSRGQEMAKEQSGRVGKEGRPGGWGRKEGRSA